MNFESFKTKYNYDVATPVMKQYLDIKFANFECLVLFRMGDFYELFFEDAVIASSTLGIALTKRGKSGEDDIPMCGVPYHALENYLNKLIEEGQKIAICEQLETPEDAKKRGGYKAVVNRNVVRIITPGTISEESLITANTPNYLASIVMHKNLVSICYVDISTAELNILEIPQEQLINQLEILAPREILIAENFRGQELVWNITAQVKTQITYQVDSFFAASKCEKIILAFYNIASVKAIGELTNAQISSLGSILEYISLTQKQNILKLSFPKIIYPHNFMTIDSATRRNLEIMQNLSGGIKGTLREAIDYTVTKSGSRLLHKFLCNPLLHIDEINTRLAFTEFFYTNFSLTEDIRKLLVKASDIERILVRLYTNKATARDLLSIKSTLETALSIKLLFTDRFGLNIPKVLDNISKELSGDEEIITLVHEAIKEEPTALLSDGGFIKVDYHPKVKELYDLINNGKARIEKLKTGYQNETGIDTLKILHNNMLGLYIEITSRHVNKIPTEKFIHRQTTLNSVRYTTNELRKLESEMVNAKSLAINLEQELFKQICEQILDKTSVLQNLASALSNLDIFTNFAYIAKEYNYSRPQLTNDNSFKLQDARHPVIEKAINPSRSFIPNDCNLSFDERIWLITGPNMSGKSTFLRQNALIAILAQIGSFIPASFGKIGVIDKIFSRIGAGDDLLKGASTFMVEMLEVSAILAQSTDKSLVILDEVGRGTSTYDGVSIAWAVLEHIHDKLKCRCLFATHYFELTILSKSLLALKNYTVAIKEIEDKILFLHKIIKGAADKSYGIHVAELAGLPASVINRANDILAKLENESNMKGRNILKTQTNNLELFAVEN